MKRDKIITQLESHRATIKAALADDDGRPEMGEHPAYYHGYWKGALFHNTEALTMLTGKELQ